MTTGGLRVLAVVLTALGGGVGALATHRQIQEGNQKRIDADRMYYEERGRAIERARLEYRPDEVVEPDNVTVDKDGTYHY